MLIFRRNKDRSLDPRLEALPSWNQLVKDQGLGNKPTLGDITLVFQRFCQLSFYGKPQRLIFEIRPDHIRLKRCFGDRGCLLLRMGIPARVSEIVDFPLEEKDHFFRAVKANPNYRTMKKMPIEAFGISYQSQP